MIHILELEFLIITTLLVEVTDGGLVLITMVFCLELLDLVSPQYKQPPISPKYCDFSVESQVGHTLCPSMPLLQLFDIFLERISLLQRGHSTHLSMSIMTQSSFFFGFVSYDFHIFEN